MRVVTMNALLSCNHTGKVKKLEEQSDGGEKKKDDHDSATVNELGPSLYMSSSEEHCGLADLT